MSEEERIDAEKEVLSILEKHDSGEGVEFSKVQQESSLSQDYLQEVVNTLLSDGTIYEPRPDHLKKL